MNNFSAFLANKLFEFENHQCICQKETIYDVPGQDPHYRLKVCALLDKEPYHFAYSSQKGLKQIGNADDTASEDIIGELLAIPNGDIDCAIEFLTQYGFLFPINSDRYEPIDDVALFSIINRVKATVLLMGAISGECDYKKILRYTTYLLYSDPVELKLFSTTYSTAKTHTYTDLIRHYSTLPGIDKDAEGIDNPVLVWDSIKKANEKLYIDDIAAVDMGDYLNGIVGSDAWHFRNLFCLYSNYRVKDFMLRTTIDFYYNYQKSVAVFKNIDIDRISYFSDPKVKNFTDDMKEALLKIAKATLSTEINANLHGLHPRFNADTLSPSWEISSFLEALYFSVFYINPKVELYKECENPNCRHKKYFPIKATVTNKKYCCAECANAAAQRRSRQRKQNLK